MTIAEIISRIDDQDLEMTIYAEKVNGEFMPSSKAKLIEVPDEDDELPTEKIAEKYCPGYEYFLELFLVKELLEDLEDSTRYKTAEQKIDAIIHYAEFDSFEIEE